nr:hypothetical protein CFP56_10251 [Quercus suber]
MGSGPAPDRSHLTNNAQSAVLLDRSPATSTRWSALCQPSQFPSSSFSSHRRIVAMRSVRSAEQALRLVGSVSKSTPPFICTSCRKHQARQLHTTPTLLAESSQPWWRKLADGVFSGKEKAVKAAEVRTSANKEQALADETAELKTFTAPDGTVYEYARRYDPTVSKDYQPAETGENLERVGSPSWVKRQLDQGERYRGANKRIQLDAAQWKRLLHHVAVEALTLRKHGINLANFYQETRNGKRGEAWAASLLATMKADRLGKSTVEFQDPSHEKQIMDAAGIGPPPEVMRDVGAPKLSLFVLIKDPLVKFAIAQRILQLTGHRLPDSTVSNAKTLHDFYTTYRQVEPAKKLAAEPKVQQFKSELPNVKWHKTKHTMIQKEQAVGRWKIIEAELAKRDLPITGTRWKRARASTR